MSDEDEICLNPQCHDTEPPKTVAYHFPSFFQQASGFINTAKDIVGGAMAGDGVKVSEQVYKKRMDTCMDCDYLEKESIRCMKCGCFMKTKTAFKKTYCPIGKWKAEE